MKIMNLEEIERVLKRLCQKFLSKNENLDGLIVVGIQVVLVILDFYQCTNTRSLIFSFFQKLIERNVNLG